ncbi:MAG: hypothetical protein ABEJ66_01345, partial [Candidatus Nanohaloarchaea archaeon]
RRNESRDLNMVKKLMLAVAALLLLGSSTAKVTSATGASTDTQVFTLHPGWNTISPDVSGVSFQKDFLNGRNSCTFGWWNQGLEKNGVEPGDIPEKEQYFVWAQWGGRWSHPDDLQPSRAYSVYLDSESSCEVKVSGVHVDAGTVTMQDGWNLVNPQGITPTGIKQQCELRWWNQALEEGVDSQVQDSGKYFFWVREGDTWEHPFREGTGFTAQDGVYINTAGRCRVDLSPGYTRGGDGNEKDVSYPDREAGDIPYRTVERRWDLSQAEMAALAGIPKSFAPSYPYSRQSLASLVKKLRERAVALNWNHGARTAARYYNPEDINVGGSTYFVTSEEGWVLRNGPAPHCYDGHYYEPPVYGSLSDKVAEAVPKSDPKFSDTDKDDECPAWLDDQLLSHVSQMVRKEVEQPASLSFELKSLERSSGLDYTGATVVVNGREYAVSEEGVSSSFTVGDTLVTVQDIIVYDAGKNTGKVKLAYSGNLRVLEKTSSSSERESDSTRDTDGDSRFLPNWNGWQFGKKVNWSRSDTLDEVHAGDNAVIDTGDTGYCGKAYYRKVFTVTDDTADRLEIGYSLVMDEYAGAVYTRVDGERQVRKNPSGGGRINTSGTWTVYLGPGDTVVEVGIRDASRRYCDNSDHSIRLEITSVSRSDTSMAIS